MYLSCYSIKTEGSLRESNRSVTFFMICHYKCAGYILIGSKNHRNYVLLNDSL